MRHHLVCHPDTPQSAVSSIRVDIARRPHGYVTLEFRAVGAMGEVRWPGEATGAPGPWTRADGLWQHSCFEAFATVPGETGYFEANFATSGRWAAYGFIDYRAGMRAADDIELAAGGWSIRPRRAILNASLRVPVAYEGADWLMGASAVIEATDGAKSYWALSHPPGPPDFHNRDCFVAAVPAPRAA